MGQDDISHFALQLWWCRVEERGGVKVRPTRRRAQSHGFLKQAAVSIKVFRIESSFKS